MDFSQQELSKISQHQDMISFKTNKQKLSEVKVILDQISVVCEQVTGVPQKYMFYKKSGITNRDKEATHLFCYLARTKRIGTKVIGQYLGKDHTSVVVSSYKFKSLMDIDQQRVKWFNDAIELIGKSITT